MAFGGPQTQTHQKESAGNPNSTTAPIQRPHHGDGHRTLYMDSKLQTMFGGVLNFSGALVKGSSFDTAFLRCSRGCSEHGSCSTTTATWGLFQMRHSKSIPRTGKLHMGSLTHGSCVAGTICESDVEPKEESLGP